MSVLRECEVFSTMPNYMEEIHENCHHGGVRKETATKLLRNNWIHQWSFRKKIHTPILDFHSGSISALIRLLGLLYGLDVGGAATIRRYMLLPTVRHLPPPPDLWKRPIYRLHGATYLKIAVLIFTAVRTLNYYAIMCLEHLYVITK
jgi:hypothetical protein